MKTVVRLVSIFVVLVGIVGAFAPDTLVSLGRAVLTPGGLYVIAAFRIFIGVALFLAAPGSRAPRTMRILGALVVIGGLATPLVGLERSRAILEWESVRTAWIRLGAMLALALGSFIAFAVTTGRRLSSV